MVKPTTFRILVLLLIITELTASCNSIRESSKFGFREGYYKSRIYHKKLKSIYVIPADDSIKVYTVKGLKKVTDTLAPIKIAFPLTRPPGNYDSYIFRQNSFDVDVLSILFKYRPGIKGFPNQLNTSILNGAVYVGYRSDLYKLHYRKNPVKGFTREVSHVGFSFGAFTGIGASRIDEFVTQNGINIQYDGVVNPSGIAAIIALNKLSFGLMLGEDHLLDKNRQYWIYEGKPWVGLSVGLNLN